MRIATPAFFCFPFAWNIFFHLLTFSLYVSLGRMWVSCRQNINGSCFCSHSASLCLLLGAFNPFTLKVIIDIYVPINHFLNCFGFALVDLFLLLYFLTKYALLTFVIKLAWWYWLLLTFACLISFLFPQFWVRALLATVILVVDFSFSCRVFCWKNC